jgi:RHS repeat-associated protein
MSITRAWNSSEKILLHFEAVRQPSGEKHWSYAGRSGKEALGSVVTYDYDAFGNLIHQTGTTYNNYLFAGEQFDPDLNLYYNRARYLNVSTGRFWTMDTYEGSTREPASLHKYQYVRNSPTIRRDRSGHFDAAEVQIASTIGLGLDSANVFAGQNIFLGALACLDKPHADCGQSIASEYIAFLFGFVSVVTPGQTDPFQSELAGAVNGWVRTNWYFPSEAAENYQAQITGRPGWGYYKGGVEFDGVKGKTLVDAKYNYGQFVDPRTKQFVPWWTNGIEDETQQMLDQIEAADGQPITWYCSDQRAVDGFRGLADDIGVGGKINFEWEPPIEFVPIE